MLRVSYTSVKIRVPGGAGPGDLLQFVTGGQTLSFQVPAGAKPGTVLQISMPHFNLPQMRPLPLPKGGPGPGWSGGPVLGRCVSLTDCRVALKLSMSGLGRHPHLNRTVRDEMRFSVVMRLLICALLHS